MHVHTRSGPDHGTKCRGPDWSPCGYRVPESGLGTQLGPHHPPSVHTRLSMVCTPDFGRLDRLSPLSAILPVGRVVDAGSGGLAGGGREQHQASIRRTSSPRSWRSSRGASGSAARSLCAVLSGRGWRPLLPSLPRAVMLRRETFLPRSRCPPRRRAAGLLGQTDRSHLGGRIPPSGCGSGSAPLHCEKVASTFAPDLEDVGVLVDEAFGQALPAPVSHPDRP